MCERSRGRFKCLRAHARTSVRDRAQMASNKNRNPNQSARFTIIVIKIIVKTKWSPGFNEIEHKTNWIRNYWCECRFLRESFAEVEQQRNQTQKEWTKTNCSANKCEVNEQTTRKKHTNLLNGEMQYTSRRNNRFNESLPWNARSYFLSS